MLRRAPGGRYPRNDQTPAIAEHLDVGVDRAPRPRLFASPNVLATITSGITVSESGCESLTKGGPMLTRVAEGVLTHQSELLQNNAVVV